MAFIETTATKKIKRMALTHIREFPKSTEPRPPARIRIVQGGTSASKTISILMYLIAKAQQHKEINNPTLTSIVSESIPHLKRGAIRDFINIMTTQGYFKQDRWNATDSIYTFETGSKIEFFSSDNGDKLRGARRDRLFINEANNVTFDAFNQLEVRTKEFIFMDYNPTNEFWAFTEIMNPVDSLFDWEKIIITYKDNEALSENIINSIETRRNRKGWWDVYGLGQLGEVEGKIYKDWGIIDEIPHEAKLERYGLDFGYSNDPTAIVGVYRYNGGYILDEILFQKEMSNKQIADVLLNQDKALVIADSAEPKSIDELKNYGINVLPAEKGRDSVEHGIQYVQDQRISMTRRSANLINEYRNYLWRTDKLGQIMKNPSIPEQGYDHLLDATRYAIVSMKNPTPNKVAIFKPRTAGFRKY
jgi:phage terminase large subunit